MLKAWGVAASFTTESLPVMILFGRHICLPLLFGLAAFGLMAAMQVRAAESAGKNTTPVVCEIRGQVADLRQVTPGDTPTALAGTETHIYVSVLDRTSRYKKQAENDPCFRREAKELRTYKLCSPTRVKKGDVINGTEGTNTGPSSPVGCLFDLVVLSQQ